MASALHIKDNFHNLHNLIIVVTVVRVVFYTTRTRVIVSPRVTQRLALQAGAGLWFAFWAKKAFSFCSVHVLQYLCTRNEKEERYSGN